MTVKIKKTQLTKSGKRELPLDTKARKNVTNNTDLKTHLVAAAPAEEATVPEEAEQNQAINKDIYSDSKKIAKLKYSGRLNNTNSTSKFSEYKERFLNGSGKWIAIAALVLAIIILVIVLCFKGCSNGTVASSSKTSSLTDSSSSISAVSSNTTSSKKSVASTKNVKSGSKKATTYKRMPKPNPNKVASNVTFIPNKEVPNAVVTTNPSSAPSSSNTSSATSSASGPIADTDIEISTDDDHYELTISFSDVKVNASTSNIASCIQASGFKVKNSSFDKGDQEFTCDLYPHTSKSTRIWLTGSKYWEQSDKEIVNPKDDLGYGVSNIINTTTNNNTSTSQTNSNSSTSANLTNVNVAVSTSAGEVSYTFSSSVELSGSDFESYLSTNLAVTVLRSGNTYKAKFSPVSGHYIKLNSGSSGNYRWNDTQTYTCP